MRKTLSACAGLGMGALLAGNPAFAQMDEIDAYGDQRAQQEQREQADRQEGIGGAGAQDPMAGQQFQISGQVERVSPDDKVLRVRDPENNFVVPLAIEDRANIQMNGEKVALSEVPEGARVRASYTIEGDKLVANDVVVQRAQPGTGGAGEAGGQTRQEFSVRGSVATAGSDSLRILSDDPDYYVSLDVPRDAQVVMQGRTIAVSEIPEGAEVRATYMLRGDALVARTVIITPQERMERPEEQDRLEPAQPEQPGEREQ